MKLTKPDKLKKEYSTPEIYTIDPNDLRISRLKKQLQKLPPRPALQRSDPQDLSAEIMGVSRSSRSQAPKSSVRKPCLTPR